MTAIHLRPATPLDAGRVGAILSDWIDTTDWMPRVHTRAEDLAHAGTLVSRGWVMLAIRGNEVAGFLARDATDIHALYVGARQRRQKVGSTLLEHAKSASPRLSLWTFQHNTRAQAFYERHGFTIVERTDGSANDEGLPDIRYVWTKEGIG